MPFYVGSKRLTPAPFLTFSKQLVFANDGSPLNTKYDISLQGTLLPNRGSPSSTGWSTIPSGQPSDESFTTDDTKFSSILNKQEYLKELLSTTGNLFTYAASTGSSVTFYGKLNTLSFTPGNWVIRCDYNAQLETNKIDRQGSVNEDYFIYDDSYVGLNLTNVSDSYTIKEREDGLSIIDVSRTISAKSEYIPDSTGSILPWQQAKIWVLNRKQNYPFDYTVLGSSATGVIFTTGNVLGIASTGYEEGSGIDWSNEGLATEVDNNIAAVILNDLEQSKILTLSGFNFNIPSNSVIKSIQGNLTYLIKNLSASSGSTPLPLSGMSIYLYLNGNTQFSFAPPYGYSDVNIYTTTGIVLDKTGITADIINNSLLLHIYSANLEGITELVAIDAVTLNVDYFVPMNSGYNLIEDETIDQIGGQYSLSQRFILANNLYVENRTINRTYTPNRLGDGGPFIEVINVNGSITGLDPFNIPVNKFTNASGYWSTASGTIQSAVGAFGDPVNLTVNENHQLGIIEYSYQFINNSGIWYKHSYDVGINYSQNDNPTVTINGVIDGYTPNDLYYGTGANYNKFDNALSGWNLISTGIKNLAFSYPSLVTSGLLFSDNPVSKNISYNKANGTINYSYGFIYTSGSSTNYQNNYTIDLSTDNAPANYLVAGLNCKASINGQIIGLASGNDPSTKYNNATIGWQAIQSNLFSIVNGQFSLLGSGTPSLSSGFISRTISSDPRGGTINYSASFTNTPPTSSGIVAVEDVTVENNNASDIFAVQLIPGLSSGPIIQNIATTSERRKTINIALTLYAKPTAPYYWSYSDITIPQTVASGIASGLVPTGVRGTNYWFASDNENWNFRGGLYSRNLTLVY